VAYFKLTSPARLKAYPFDYHSHFGGILPVEKPGFVAAVDYEVEYQPPDSQAIVRYERGRELSLVGLLGGTGAHAAIEGNVRLFGLALTFMLEGNPLAILAHRLNQTQYERGECAAESIYIACVLLARRFGLPDDIVQAPATEPTLYQAMLEMLPRATAGLNETSPLLQTLRYFNRKIYSANKYTPFDDAYKTRSAALKIVRRGPQGGQAYAQWIVATLAYLVQEGITHSQTAVGEDEIRQIDAIAHSFNERYTSYYKVLVHTPAGYAEDGRLKLELENKILPLLTGADDQNVVGLDLLGTENKVGNYQELFEFLHQNQSALEARFGDKLGARSLKLIVHVHCGEGAGASPDNRSMLGSCFSGSPQPPQPGFYRAFADYIIRCQENAWFKQFDEKRGTSGAHARKQNSISGLFEELFHNNSLTWNGTTLRRFDVTSETTRELVSYNAKRNVMAFSETLDGEPPGAQVTWYDILTAPGTPYAIRLGHDYYYRNYMAARYDQIAFDTNLGSNSITGAAGLFTSVESYRINRGFRHLEGYIDTNVLHAASVSIAYMGADTLSQLQIELFMDVSRGPGPMDDVLGQSAVAVAIKAQLQIALGPVCPPNMVDGYYAIYAALVGQIVGETTSRAIRYQALSRVFTLFRNWRSYLLGADGQGVEHTDIQDEFLRMVILLAYNLLPIGQERIESVSLALLQELLLTISAAYWQVTIAGGDIVPQFARLDLDAVDGFKSPASVVTVRRKGVGE